MKKTLSLCIFAALLAAGCGGTGQSAELQKVSTPDFVFTIDSSEEAILYGIQDHDQTMSAELFKGFDDELLTQLMPEGMAEAGVNVFLACRGSDNILFDAGLGADKGGRLLEALDSIGITPDKITDICITHLHLDHVGGLFNPDGTAVFPSATLHIPQTEYDAWASGKMGNSEITSKIEQTYEGRIHLFAQGDTLPGSIATIAAPGHTPGHTIYSIGDVLIAGDIIHAVALQVEHPEFCARFDADPQQAVATRKAVLDRTRAERLTLCGMHFPKPLKIVF